jgi:hypothetical protein
VDAFADLFRGVRAQGSLFSSSTLSAPWSLLFVDGAPLTLCTVLEGSGWIVPEGCPPENLAPGDTLIVRAPRRSEPIECGEHCATPEKGGTLHRLGWNDCGAGDPADATTLVVGACPVRGEIGRRLLDALPDVLRVAPGGTADAVRDLLAAEVAVDAPGQQVVLDRLLDWMLVCSRDPLQLEPGIRARRRGSDPHDRQRLIRLAKAHSRDGQVPGRRRGRPAPRSHRDLDSTALHAIGDCGDNFRPAYPVAPRSVGKTAAVSTSGTRFSINMIPTITGKEALRCLPWISSGQAPQRFLLFTRGVYGPGSPRLPR